LAASAAIFWKRDISSASERAFPGGFGDFLVAQLPPKRGFVSTQEFTRFLSTVSSQRRATRSDVSFQTKQCECLITVELTQTHLGRRLCFIQVVWSPPSWSRRVTQIMPAEALLLNGFGYNPQKPTSTTFSIRSACAPGSCRTKLLQTVAMRVLAATASFYSARGIGSQASAGAAVDEELRRAGKTCCQHKASGFQASKSVGFRRGIPPAVPVCYKLFWNWNDVVRFVSQDKGFVIWHFHTYCLVQIVSLWSFSIGVRIIFTTNELVDRVRNFKSSASRF